VEQGVGHRGELILEHARPRRAHGLGRGRGRQAPGPAHDLDLAGALHDPQLVEDRAEVAELGRRQGRLDALRETRFA